MKRKIEKKLIRKISMLAILGILLVVSISVTLTAQSWGYDITDNDSVRIIIDDDTTASDEVFAVWHDQLGTDAEELFRIQEDGKVGIGTTSPQNSLAVAGGVVIGSNYAGTVSGSANGMVVEGHVGIGTTYLPAIFNTKTVYDPAENHGGGAEEDDLTWGGAYTETSVITYKVEIDEDSGPIDTFKWSQDGGSNWVQELVPIEVGSFPLSYGVQITFAAQDGHSKGEWWSCQTNYWGPLMLFNAADTLIFTVHNGGGVAIGQVPAEARLDVNPTVTRTDDYIGIKSDMEFDPGSGTMTTWTGIKVASPTITSGSITNKYALVTESGAGNVGIGTTSPTVELDVNGDIYSQSISGKVRVGYAGGAGLHSIGPILFYADSDNSGDDAYYWHDNTETTVMTLSLLGNLGIGPGNPTASLHVDQSVSDAAKPVLTLDQADIDYELMKVIGTSTDNIVDRTLVEDDDFDNHGLLIGWIQIEIDDTTNVLDGSYYIPFYDAPFNDP